MKTFILRELFKLIKQESILVSKTKFNYYKPIIISIIKKYITIIIAVLAIIISIHAEYKTIVHQAYVKKEITKLKEICEPLQGKIKQFNDTYLEEIK